MSNHKTNLELRGSIARKLVRLVFLPLIAVLAVGGLAGLAIAGSLATQTIVSFEGLGYSDFQDLGSKIITNQGFTLTASDANWESFSTGTGFCNNGSNGCAAMADQPGHAETITIQMVTGDRFKFTSFWIGNHGNGGGVAKVEGFRNGNPTPVATLNSGFPANGDFSAATATIALSSAFQDVDKVVITSNSSTGFYDVFDDFQFDPPVRVSILATSAATSITTTGATLNGTADDNTATSTISFDYGLTTAYGSNIAATTGGTVTAGAGATAAAVTLSGLTCATTYHFRLNGTNSFGVSQSADASFTTSACPQTITFAQPATQSFGTTPTLTASATSSLTVTFSSSTTGVCTITSGGALTFVTTGTCTINADQAGNAGFSAAPQVTRSFSVAAVVPGAPTIGTATPGDTQASVSFTAPGFSGGAGITGYTMTASPGGATGTGMSSPVVVTGLSNGTSYTFTVTATNSAGTGSASTASNSVTPIGTQTITFAQPATQSFGATPTLTATATSSLTVSFTSSTTGVCTITGGGALTFVTTGTCTINADQAGNAGFSAAPQVTRSFSVAAVVPGAPTIGTATPGDTQASVSFTAPGFSGGAGITGYTVTASPGGATGSGMSSPIIVTGLSNGTSYTFTVTATNSAGTGSASAASNSVTPIATQTISFGVLAAKPLNNPPFTVSATATSGLTVLFSSTTLPICTVAGNTVTLVALGTCTIAANQAGNAAFSAAPQVTQSFIVSANTQTISFGTIANVLLGGSNAIVSASASSGLTVSFASLTATVCSVNGSSVTALSLGTCTIQATQAGNGSFSAATPVSQSFTVLPGAPNAPTLTSCTAGSRTASCAFTPPTANGSPAPTGYTLTCQTGANAPVQASGTTSPLVIAGLVNGPTYQCRVTANNANGSSVASNAIAVTAFSKLAAGGSADINGDGKAEVLLRAANATTTATLNANNKLDLTPITGPGPEWRILGTGDFRGNHHSDLLIQNIATGDVRVWLNFDGPPDSDIFLRNVKPGWVVEAIADLDGDGKSDIVWRYVGSTSNPPANPDDVGVVFVWFMNGTGISEIKARGGAPASWNLVGVTDLDGDGLGDLVWQSPLNTVRGIFGLSGRNFVNKLLGTAPAGYGLVKVADFDGDGNGDLLFRNAAGKVKLWRMNGATLLAEVNLPDTDATWVFYAAADLNGDQTADIIWKKPDGTLVLWLMNAATPAAPTIVDPAGTAPTGYNVIE